MYSYIFKQKILIELNISDSSSFGKNVQFARDDILKEKNFQLAQSTYALQKMLNRAKLKENAFAYTWVLGFNKTPLICFFNAPAFSKYNVAPGCCVLLRQINT